MNEDWVKAVSQAKTLDSGSVDAIYMVVQLRDILWNIWSMYFKYTEGEREMPSPENFAPVVARAYSMVHEADIFLGGFVEGQGEAKK